MKNIAKLLTIILTLCLGKVHAGGGGSTTTLNPLHDSVLTARAFALHTPDRFDLYVYVQTNEGGTLVDYWMFGTRLPDGSITRLTVDNVLVLDENDPPLWSLPLPTKGSITYVSCNLTGYESGQFVSYGNFYSGLFKRGDAISVLMYPASVKVLAKYKLPAGVNGNDLWINVENGAGGYYDYFAQGFYLYVDPSVSSSRYWIIDQHTGVTLLTGIVHPYDGQVLPPTTSTTSLTYIDGVLDGTPDEAIGGFRQYLGQQLDGQTIDDATGAKTPCKTMFVRLKGKPLLVWIGGIKGVVEIFDASNADGDMPSVFKGNTIPNPYDGGYYINITQPGGYDAVVIKITGTPKPEGFNVGVSNEPKG